MLFDIFYVNGIFYTRLNGEPDPLSLQSYYKSLTSHKEWKDFSKVLSDETATTYKRLKSDDIGKLAQISTSFKNEIKNSSIAVYVDSDYKFGMARMWQAYVEAGWDAKVCVFRSYEKARSWLIEQ